MSSQPAVDPHAALLQQCFALQRSEPAQAIVVADSLLSEKLPRVTEIKALSCLGTATSISGDAARAIDAATRMEKLLDGASLPSDIVLRTLSAAGSILHAAGQTSRALVLYGRAERAADAADAEAVQVANLMNIGAIHGEILQNPEGAEVFFERAAALTQPSGKPDLLLYYNHASNLVRLGRARDAMAQLDLAAAEASRVGSVLISQRVAALRAHLLHGEERSEEARALLEHAIAIQKTLPDPAGESRSLHFLSDVQRSSGDAQAALASAQAAEALAMGDGAIAERLDAIDAQVAALRALGRLDEALDTANRGHGLSLATLKRENIESLADVQARLQDADSGRELQRLRHERQLQRLSVERARLARNWAIAVLALVAIGVLVFILYQRAVNKRLRRLSTVDALTGLVNRRAATHRLGVGLADNGAVESARSLVLLVDIDHFKQINDRYGHAVGDMILTELSARLKTGCRPDDIVSRWGGEEFLIACGRVTLDQARAVAERLRAAIADVPFPLPDGQRVAATISIGFAPYPFFPGIEDHGEQPWQDAIRLADRALYAAKHSGRDAWVGLWGHEIDGGDIDAVLRDPPAAEARRQIAVLGSRPVEWSAVTADHAAED